MEGGFSSDRNVGPSAGVTSPVIDEARLRNFINMPIQFMGTICNVIVLWVLSAEPVYVPSTDLFKALAVADILYLQFAFVYDVNWYPGYTHDKVLFVEAFLSTMAYGNQKNGLLISLVLATSRVIKLFFPLHARRLLAKSRMRIVVICCLLFSIGMQTFNTTRLVYLPDDEPGAKNSNPYFRKVLGYTAPASLQIVLMLVVAYKVLRQKAQTAPFVADLSSVRRSKENSKTEVCRSPCFQTRTTQSRQFVYVVFAICYMTFLAHVVTSTAFVLISKYCPDESVIRKKARVVNAVFGSINSSVNIIFYMLIPRFRHKFIDNMDKLLQKLGVSTTTETSSAFVVTTASRGNTCGKHGEGDGERTETDRKEETDNNLPDSSSLKSLAKKGDSTFIT